MKILIPTDFSKLSRVAVHYAVKMAKKLVSHSIYHADCFVDFTNDFVISKSNLKIMKNSYINTSKIIGMLLFLLFAISCSSNKPQANENEKISVSDSTEIKFQAMKEKYSPRIKEKIIETDKKIEGLNAQLDKAKGKLQSKLKEEIAEWQAKRKILKETWDKIGKVTNDNWENFEKEMKDALGMEQDSVKVKQTNNK